MNRNLRSETEITRKCTSHLNREIELLEKYIEVSNAIYDNVGVAPEPPDGDGDWIESLNKRSGALADERNQLKVDLADFLAVPTAQATIRALLDVISPENAKTISQQRTRLLDLEAEIQKQNRTNSFLIRQSMDLYRRIAIELTDQKPSAPTYSSSGELTGNDSANFLQTDC